jgi:very-short-patch-repair endonuclease
MLELPTMDDDQQQFARRMRAEPTDAERVLWQRLRHDITLVGSHFRRQAAIGPFIVDFASRRAKLVIELDGGQHADNTADDRRTSYLVSEGYRVLRFWNNDVLENTSGVLLTIDTAINADRPPTPDPSPPQAGGGE